MDLQTFTQMLGELERETNSAARQQIETEYFAFRDSQPDLYIHLILLLIQQNAPCASFACILLRRDCTKSCLESALYRAQNPHDTVLKLMPYLLEQNHLLEVITQHLQFCLQKDIPFPEFNAFMQQLTETSKILASQITAEVLTLPISLNKKTGIDFYSLAQEFLGEDDGVAALAMKALANYAFLTENGLPKDVFCEVLGRYQAFLSQERTPDFKILDEMSQQIGRIVDFSKNVIEVIFPELMQMAQMFYQQSNDKLFKLRMLKIGAKFMSGVEKIDGNVQIITIIQEFLRVVIIPSIGAYTDDQMQEWLEIGNLEFQADDLIENAQKTIELLSIKWASSVVNPILRQCFAAAAEAPADYRYSIACMMGLNFAAEGFAGVISKADLQYYIENIIKLISVSNQHPRVLYSAANVIGQLANDFDAILPEFQAVLMPILLKYSDYPVIHVRSHFLAAILNYSICMDIEQLRAYKGELIAIVQTHFSENDYYMKSNVLSTLCTVIEITGESEISPVLSSIIPQILQIFEQIMQSISSDEELSKNQLDLVQRVIEVLGFAVSFFPHLFGDVKVQILHAYQTAMNYAYNHRVIDILNQSIRSILKIQKCVDISSILQNQIQLFTGSCKLKNIIFNNSASQEGAMHIDTSVTDLQLAMFQIVNDEVAASPALFTQYYNEIYGGIMMIYSDNQLLSMLQFSLLINLLRVAANISQSEYYQLQNQILQQLSTDIDDSAVDSKHYELETLQYVFQSFKEYFCIARENAPKYGYLNAQLIELSIQIITFSIENTKKLLDDELQIISKSKTDMGEIQKFIKICVQNYFNVYEYMGNAVTQLINAADVNLVELLHPIARELFQLTNGSNSEKDAPILQIAIGILGDLAQKYQFTQADEQQAIIQKVYESDNPRLLYYCVFYACQCQRLDNTDLLLKRAAELYAYISEEESLFSGCCEDYLAILITKLDLSQYELLFEIKNDELAADLAIKMLLSGGFEFEQIEQGLMELKKHCSSNGAAAIEHFRK